MAPIDRRTLLTAAGAALAAPKLAFGQAAKGPPLQVFAHRVHKTVATGQSGDVTAPWTAETGIAVEWTTFDTGPLQERLFREASLSQTSVDVGFIVNTQAVPRTAELFEPLDDYMRNDPPEDVADIFPGLIDGMTVAGKLIAIPVRHASSGLHWNTEILAERGFPTPPATMEELVEVAKATTYRRADGTNCVGLCMPGVTYPNVIDIARAWDGDFITKDFKVVADQEGMLNAIRLLRGLFEAGAFPRNFSALTTEEVATWMQQGRAAMALQSMGRTASSTTRRRASSPARS